MTDFTPEQAADRLVFHALELSPAERRRLYLIAVGGAMATEPKIGDPADRAADGQFQPAPASSDPAKQRLFRWARRGTTLGAGEGKRIIEHYETAIRNYLILNEDEHTAELRAALDVGKD